MTIAAGGVLLAALTPAGAVMGGENSARQFEQGFGYQRYRLERVAGALPGQERYGDPAEFAAHQGGARPMQRAAPFFTRRAAW